MSTEAVDRLLPETDTEELLAEERRQVDALCQRAQHALNDLGLGALVVRPSGHGSLMTFGSLVNRRAQDALVRRLEQLAEQQGE